MAEISNSLSFKQLRWIDEYMLDLNGAAAAVRAGYSAKSARSIAHENLTKPDIQAVLQARQAEMASDLKLSRQGVIQGLVEAVNMGREQQNPGAMIAALREVAKMLGFYAPEVKRIELTTDQRSMHNDMTDLTDAELLALIKRHSAPV
ncbi:MAG: terminase small subunit [Pseudomonadota bacterium]